MMGKSCRTISFVWKLQFFCEKMISFSRNEGEKCIFTKKKSISFPFLCANNFWFENEGRNCLTIFIFVQGGAPKSLQLYFVFTNKTVKILAPHSVTHKPITNLIVVFRRFSLEKVCVVVVQFLVLKSHRGIVVENFFVYGFKKMFNFFSSIRLRSNFFPFNLENGTHDAFA